MDIEIRPLTPALLDDFLFFFENVAFSDHPEWSECYCTHFHWDAKLESDWKRSGGTKRGRDYAMEFIRSGVMQGYLAYREGEIVGWCNANEKSNFGNLVERAELWDGADRDAKVKAVVCFVVAPGMRGKGIATRLLERACRDAVSAGYDYMEAYPCRGETDEYTNHHGPFALYEKCGFSLYKDLGRDSIVRKRL
jgi:GNAT superfamily N-acetyltransferase